MLLKSDDLAVPDQETPVIMNPDEVIHAAFVEDWGRSAPQAGHRNFMVTPRPDLAHDCSMKDPSCHSDCMETFCRLPVASCLREDVYCCIQLDGGVASPTTWLIATKTGSTQSSFSDAPLLCTIPSSCHISLSFPSNAVWDTSSAIHILKVGCLDAGAVAVPKGLESVRRCKHAILASRRPSRMRGLRQKATA